MQQHMICELVYSRLNVHDRECNISTRGFNLSLGFYQLRCDKANSGEVLPIQTLVLIVKMVPRVL